MNLKYPFSQAVAAEVRAEAARLRMPKTGLAKKLGMSKSSFDRRFSGQYPFSIDELELIAQLLRTPLSALLKRVAENGGIDRQPDSTGQ